MGEKKLGKPPLPKGEHEIYLIAIRFNKLPDEIRSMTMDDYKWLRTYLIAMNEAEKELKRRNGNK